jgi:MoaA/NifB/PqqE/SkfB family radical SAM enzyme
MTFSFRSKPTLGIEDHAMTACEGKPHRTVQIHPSLRCNLACQHCYSSSGPAERARLPQPIVERLIRDAQAAGYNALAVSGGEPLLWPGLASGLAVARACSMVTSLTTNGIPLTVRRVAALHGLLDLMAISLDGVPASHDRMRGQTGAFSAMAARLAGVRAAGIPFGFLFTLTDTNLDELPWVAQFAIEHGAALLQIHPLEAVGRARTALPGARPGEIAANAAYLASMRLQERVAGQLRVHLDLAHRDVLRAHPELAQEGVVDRSARLADLVEQLVVEADGTVVPMQHGFPRAHALGNLHHAPLPILAERWRADGLDRYRSHCARIVAAATADQEALPAFNWHELVAA